jgi:MYXO-CTERM domain-containing protein
MRPKRTFFRAERVRVVPPEGESPPQAPPEALPAAGAAGGPARRRRRRRPCPPQAFAGEFALAGVRGTRFGSLPGPGGAGLTVRTPEQQSSPGLRLGPGGLGLSLPC